MQTLVNIWKPRNLSLKGKITIIKTLILPQIQFFFSMIYIPEESLKTIDDLLFNYLWDNKTAKIKRTTIIDTIENGGLDMVDVYAVHITAKCGWIKRLFDVNQTKWKITMLHMIQINKNILNKNINIIRSELGKTPFHKQL